MARPVKQVRSGQRVSVGKPKRQIESPLDQARGHEVVWAQVADLFDAARGIDGVSFVYVIGEDEDGPIKIGLAKDPIKRVRTMQTGNSRVLRIEHVLLGFGSLEKLLHEFWEPFAIVAPAKRNRLNCAPGTEWFRAEIREQLFPIMATAAERQAKFLRTTKRNVTELQMEQIVRDAHKEHDFVARGRDEVRLLGASGGTVYYGRGPSRI